VKHLGDLGRALWSQSGYKLPKAPPDVTTLSADIGTACFRRSYFEHGHITPAYRDAAVTAMIGFLTPYVEAAKKTATAHDTKKTSGGRKK
jgi:hypothetical protein